MTDKENSVEKLYAYVIATVSAGKSTLINALLHKRLMPSSQRACTDIITQIKNAPLDICQAFAYDQNSTLLDFIPSITLQKMRQLNSNPNITNVHLEIPIPLAPWEDQSIVLIDTPGPNNAYNTDHRFMTYKTFDDVYPSPSLMIFIFDSNNLDSTDTYTTLQHFIGAMKTKNGQLSNRILFLINKLDNYDPEEDSIPETLDSIKKRLIQYGIDHPYIFPVAARPALQFQMQIDGMEFKDDTSAKRMNRLPELHLETYAPLPPSTQKKIKMDLEICKTKKDVLQEALIHTGLPSIEAMLRLIIKHHNQRTNLLP